MWHLAGPVARSMCWVRHRDKLQHHMKFSTSRRRVSSFFLRGRWVASWAGTRSAGPPFRRGYLTVVLDRLKDSSFGDSRSDALTCSQSSQAVWDSCRSCKISRCHCGTGTSAGVRDRSNEPPWPRVFQRETSCRAVSRSWSTRVVFQ